MRLQDLILDVLKTEYAMCACSLGNPDECPHVIQKNRVDALADERGSDAPLITTPIGEDLIKEINALKGELGEARKLLDEVKTLNARGSQVEHLSVSTLENVQVYARYRLNDRIKHLSQRVEDLTRKTDLTVGQYAQSLLNVETHQLMCLHVTGIVDLLKERYSIS